MGLSSAPCLGGGLVFVGIYGPNDTEGRTALWDELVQELDVTFNWIMVGDFNMIIQAGDQLGGGGGRL